MSDPNTENVNTSGTSDKTHNLDSHALEDTRNAAITSSAAVTSEEVAKQIKAATHPLRKQLKRICDLLKELRQALPRRDQETSGLTQGPSRPNGSRFENVVLLKVSFTSPIMTSIDSQDLSCVIYILNLCWKIRLRCENPLRLCYSLNPQNEDPSY